MRRRKPLIYEVGQADTHRKWDNNTGVTDNDSSMSLMFQQVNVQFQADDEHEKNQAYLAEKV